jgi:hypothetical protein
MTPRPPEGSIISVTSVGAEMVIVVPYPKGGVGRYGIVLFMLFWLGGWAFGEYHVATELVSGRGNLFMLFWLGAWTVGGALAGYTVFRIARGPEPEIFNLTRTSLRYDSGVPPLELNWNDGQNYRRSWASYFSKRVRVELDRRKLQSLQLRETDLGNRLTVDSGAARLNLANGATEIEREWLYKVLAERYSLEQVKDASAATGQLAG